MSKLVALAPLAAVLALLLGGCVYHVPGPRVVHVHPQPHAHQHHWGPPGHGRHYHGHRHHHHHRRW